MIKWGNIKRNLCDLKKIEFIYKKMAEADLGREKHPEVRPQGGHVYNYKALQHVAD